MGNGSEMLFFTIFFVYVALPVFAAFVLYVVLRLAIRHGLRDHSQWERDQQLNAPADTRQRASEDR